MSYEEITRSDADKFSLLDVMIAIAKHKKRVLTLTIGAALLTAGISLLIPNRYMASTKLLPPQQAQSGAAALLSQLGGAATAAAGMAGIKNPNDLYVGMLRSRTVADKLVKQFDLQRVFGTELMDDTRRRLADSTTLNAGKDGLITIEVETVDPKLSSSLANAYVGELVHLTKVLAVTEAAQRRVFFERQLEATKDNLAVSEASLKGGLSTRGVISVDGESRALVQTMGALRAQISAAEIQLNSMRAVVTPQNPDFKRAQENVSSLRAELYKLENGRPDTRESGPSSGSPVGLENIKLLRDVKYHQMLYELLAKQYEVARLDEAKDTALIQVLDRAVEPERKSKPARALMVLSAAVLGFLLGTAWALLIETGNRAGVNSVQSSKWSTLRSHLRFK